MKGIPAILQTKQDWINAYAYVQQRPGERIVLRARLEALLASQTAKVLKEGVQKEPDKLTPDDFEETPDPASSFARSGLNEDDIRRMLADL